MRSLDGRHIVFTSKRGSEAGVGNLHRITTDGTGVVERLLESPNRQFPVAWSPDGRLLAYFEDSQTERGWETRVVVLDEGRATRRNAPADRFSPDGRWIAYGDREVFIRPAEGESGTRQVTSGGGMRPAWSGDGSELVFKKEDRVYSVSVETDGTSLRIGPERLLFHATFGWDGQGRFSDLWDVIPDRESFIMLLHTGAEPEPGGTRVKLILNWFDELRRIFGG